MTLNFRLIISDMESEAILKAAILDMSVVEFYYDGLRRIVWPHALGVTSKGNVALRAYQVDGQSKSGKIPDWHLFTVDKILALSMVTESFDGPASGYRKGDSSLQVIIMEL